MPMSTATWLAGAGRVPVRVGYDRPHAGPASGDYAWKRHSPLDEHAGRIHPEAAGSRAPTRCRFAAWPVAERRISFEWIATEPLSAFVERLPQLMRIRRRQLGAAAGCSFGASQRGSWHCSANSRRDPANEALALMLGWNGNIDAGSQAAALYEFWLLELQKEIGLVVP